MLHGSFATPAAADGAFSVNLGRQLKSMPPHQNLSGIQNKNGPLFGRRRCGRGYLTENARFSNCFVLLVLQKALSQKLIRPDIVAARCVSYGVRPRVFRFIVSHPCRLFTPRGTVARH